jgi:CheY-like chemotaxis protein
MSLKRALVVDDSAVARAALMNLLVGHGLDVVLAASGEESIELLQRELVDVIFMDHTMPGMDGLEVVAAIKRNPRTALIPVMMYTTKEGEVYVGQARALGAIGVLPKEVHPQVLFDVLVSLGLVTDRRVADPDTPPPEGTPRRRATDLPQPRAIAPAAAMALEPLILRILNDQDALREELRVSQHELKARMAAMAEATSAQRVAARPEPPVMPAEPAESATLWKFGTAAFGIAAIVFATLFTQLRSDRKVAAEDAATSAEQVAASTENQDLKAALRTEAVRSEQQYDALIDTVMWALNRNASFPYEALAFDDTRVDLLRELLSQLVAVGFRGRVRIEAHLGEFCLRTDATGDYRLAPPDTPIDTCEKVGHPLDESSSVDERESPGFADFVATSPLLNGSGIRLELVAHDRDTSLQRYSFPPDLIRAGEWNRIAEANNRLEYSVIADQTGPR